MIYHIYAPCYVEYSSINKMVEYDWNTFRNYIAFLAGRVAPGTRRPHHNSELISCYHEAFRTWGHYHNNIVLFYHDSPMICQINGALTFFAFIILFGFFLGKS